MNEKLLFCNLGNGVSVCDEKRERNGDYLGVAHISYDRIVEFKKARLSNEAKEAIELFAKTNNMDFSASQPGTVLRPIILSNREEKIKYLVECKCPADSIEEFVDTLWRDDIRPDDNCRAMKSWLYSE